MTQARHLSAACRAADIVIAPYVHARYPCAAHLVDGRSLSPFEATLVYLEPVENAYRVVTRRPSANVARVWQRRADAAPE
ncbi:MAG: hypothetical protein CBC43_004975 [Rhizobiales bacterium TMED83]|nr:hypothetical protein [Rhodobiaceae bacterium]RPF93338.1 MAG: hypothetical protein CBC43_004975 [Rhizobiales bacterium TMED83]